jgi:glutaredoxin
MPTNPGHPLLRQDQGVNLLPGPAPGFIIIRHHATAGDTGRHSPRINAMRLFFRYFFKIVHAIVGPVLLGLDWLTSPKGIERTPGEQQRIDAQTSRLVMYEFLTCPFCIKTRRAIKRLSLNIETRDALHHAPSRRQLLEGGGQVKVPCLRITNADGNVEWMYESDDIISYLQKNFA